MYSVITKDSVVSFTKLKLAYFAKVKDTILQNLQVLKLQNQQIPEVKPRLTNRCNNIGRPLSDSRQLTTSFSYTIGNNKRENSLKGTKVS